MRDHIKISKESIWWMIKNSIGIVLLYLLYLKFIPFGRYDNIVIAKVGLFSFAGWIILIGMGIIIVYVILVEALGSLIRLIITNFPEEHTFFDSLPLFKLYTHITKADLELFDKKFTRKMVKIPDSKTKMKESDSDFCDRIVKEAINEKLKKVKR